MRRVALAYIFLKRNSFIFIIYLFIYLLLAVLGLRFCARAFSSCSKWGPLFISVCGPLTIAASLVAEHRLQTHRLSSCGPRAQLLRGTWDLPRPGLEPVSPALAGRLSTTAPPGKPYIFANIFNVCCNRELDSPICFYVPSVVAISHVIWLLENSITLMRE